jgi:hypothetical protein
MIKKIKAVAKLSTGKYATLAYGAEFDNGGTQLKVKKEMLERVIKAIDDGELTIDDYGYVKFNVYEDKPFQRESVDRSEVPF